MDTLKRWNYDIRLLIQQNPRTVLTCQVGFYGTTLACMALSTYYPPITDKMTHLAQKELDAYSVGRTASRLYQEGRVLPAAGVTLGINLLVGALGTMTLPCAVVPFSGVGLGLYRAGYWGLLFPPGGKATTWAHLVTLVLEGQAYVLAGFGGWLISRAVVQELKGWWIARTARRGSEGIESVEDGDDLEKGQGQGGQGAAQAQGDILWKAFRDNVKLYLPISGILALSAMWEAYEVIHLGIDKVKV